MSSDYAADIRKYTAKINDKAVAAIVKFCGIALRRAQRASSSRINAAGPEIEEMSQLAL